MDPKKAFERAPVLNRWIDYVIKNYIPKQYHILNNNSNNSEDSIYQCLFNIKRLILEIEYENIERELLVKFAKELEGSLEESIASLFCRGKISNLFFSFFNDHPTNIASYTCQGRKILNYSPEEKMYVGRVCRVDSFFNHCCKIEPHPTHMQSPILRTDFNELNKKDLQGFIDVIKTFGCPIVLSSGHPNAIFVVEGKSFKKLIESKLNTKEKLYRLGMYSKQYDNKGFLWVYFPLNSDSELRTPTSFDVWFDMSSYFLPRRGNNKTDGHWGTTLPLLNPSNIEEGLPEAVLDQSKGYKIDTNISGFDMGLFGVCKVDSNLDGQFKRSFKQFAEKLKVGYTP